MFYKGALLLGVVALSIGCSSGTPAETNKISPTPPVKISVPQNQEHTFSEVKDGLEFKVTLNQTRFTLQDEIKVHLKVTNVSDKDIPTFAGVAAHGCLGIGISDADKKFRLAYKPSEYDLPAAQVIEEGTLKPGASIEYERILLPQIDFYTEQTDAWGGSYWVGVGMSKEATQYTSVSFPITIESNAKKLIIPEAAEKVAYESADYIKWFSEHTGNAVAWMDGDQAYAILKSGLSKVGKELYERILNESKNPSKSTRFEKGNWLIKSVSYYGNAPTVIIIKVDAVKGNIVSIEYPKY